MRWLFLCGSLLCFVGCGQKQNVAAPTPGAVEPKAEWSFSILGSEVGTVEFVPVKMMEGDRVPKPGESTWQDLYKNLAADRDANELLKQLCKAESVTILVGEELPVTGWLPEAPTNNRSVVFRVHQNPKLFSTNSSRKVHGVKISHDFYRTGIWEPTAFATNVHNLDLAASDYMLRNQMGWVIFESPPARGEEWTAAQWRVEIDKRIKEALGLAK